MTADINVFDDALNARMDAYNASHMPGVRDLAEVVDICEDASLGFLGDPGDTRCIVFREAISLYAAKHGIAERALNAALADWRALEA